MAVLRGASVVMPEVKAKRKKASPARQASMLATRMPSPASCQLPSS